jgi:phosphoglycerate dehydrogenase-like enzyme
VATRGALSYAVSSQIALKEVLMGKLRGLFILDEEAYEMVYGPDERRAIARHVDIVGPPQTRQSIVERTDLLAVTEAIFSGWGAPILDEAFLNAAPQLKVLFYGAGSTSVCLTPSVWKRGIVVTSAYAANAIPVAEYTLSMILFSLKHGWRLMRELRDHRPHTNRNTALGCYGTTVGLVSLGIIARTLLKLLGSFDLRVLAFDPYVSEEQASALGVTLVSLDEIFRQSDVVSLHTPLLAETIGMIRGDHFSQMKRGATFINTARGEVVREAEMREVLKRRPDLQAVLDVTEHEPTLPESPLFDLPNVVLTPHLAGSVGNECLRMGQYMVEELERYIQNKPLKWAITPELAEYTSHRPVSVTTSLATKHSKRVIAAT